MIVTSPIWCPEAESNHRHEDFQSSALPTELSGHIYKIIGHIGGEGGIRTHVGLHPNGFQDRPVMTTSVPLQCGAEDEIRTRDPRLGKAMLYH